MSTIDFVILIGYVLGCTWLGVRLGRGATGLKGYFLGESDIPTWAVMVSIVATETSTATFLSVPAIAFKGDFTYLQLAIGYMVGRIIVSALLLPAYFRGEIFTAYQVLDQRFGGLTKTAASVLFLITRTLGDGLRLYLAALVLRELTGWSMPISIVAMGATTIVYTFLGGMKAVIWTDVIQFFIYNLGAVTALVVLVGELPGGWSELVAAGAEAGKFRLFDFGFDLTRPYTFWAGLIGGAVLNTATHGADQIMVQRYLSARGERQAATALIVSGVVVFAQFALFLLIGVGLFVFYREFPPGVALPKDGEFTWFIPRYLPTGVVGLVIAAIFSAAMSTLSSSLNASASATINDLYRPLRPETDEATLLRLSKAFTVVWGLAQMGTAIAATYLLQDNVVNNALAIASFITGIVLGLFLLGTLTTSVQQPHALIGLAVGAAVVTSVKFLTPIAWPWYACIGSITVFFAGCAASALARLGSSTSA
ncbi:MAG: sodium:solute symporter [Isosphaeraceae bacterium]|nr:sodium:solute symporter [Isosphaeraceae bacterium]